jgi:hypothetical protein
VCSGARPRPLRCPRRPPTDSVSARVAARDGGCRRNYTASTLQRALRRAVRPCLAGRQVNKLLLYLLSAVCFLPSACTHSRALLGLVACPPGWLSGADVPITRCGRRWPRQYSPSQASSSDQRTAASRALFLVSGASSDSKVAHQLAGALPTSSPCFID